jgi:hypothetical protein
MTGLSATSMVHLPRYLFSLHQPYMLDIRHQTSDKEELPLGAYIRIQVLQKPIAI